MNRTFLSAVIFAGAALPATGAVIAEMSPEAISRAIAEGKASKELLSNVVSKGNAHCFITTPYSRVVNAAFHAKKEYRDFGPADVTPEMVAPEASIICPSVGTNTSGMRRANVKTVLLLPKGGGEPIRPTKMEADTEKFSNAMGAKAEAEGQAAIFPLSALAPGLELHVVYDEKVAAPFKPCDDCAMDLKLDKLR